MNENIKKGVLFSILTAVVSGISIFYNKNTVVNLDSTIFNIFKNGGVALILSLVFLSSKTRNQLATFSPVKYLKLIILGIVGGGIPFILFFEGLKMVPAINANIIHKSMFIWVALLAIPFLSEKLNILQVIGYILVAWSNLFIGGFKGFTGNPGEFMILSATLLWALENIYAKKIMQDIDTKTAAWGRMFFGTIFIFIFALFQNKLPLFSTITLQQILPILGSILLLTIYTLSWYKALKMAPATMVASILVLATPITNLLSTIFVTHTISESIITNLLSTFLGVIIISLFSSLLPKKSFRISLNNQ